MKCGAKVSYFFENNKTISCFLLILQETMIVNDKQ